MEGVTLMKRPRLNAVEALAGFRLRLTFINGSIFTVSLADEFDSFPGLAPLRDPQSFAQAVIIPGEGWTVEWPDLDIQIGADTLWLDAQAQNASDENTRFFAGWRAKYGMSLKQAADALGMTARTISAYSTGARPVPRYIVLACKGWDATHGS